jgi:hypothetical protein
MEKNQDSGYRIIIPNNTGTKNISILLLLIRMGRSGIRCLFVDPGNEMEKFRSGMNTASTSFYCICYFFVVILLNASLFFPQVPCNYKNM